MRQPEATFCQMIEHLPEAVLVIQDGMFRFSNRRAEALLGYSGAELQSGGVAAIVHPEELDRVLQQAVECPCGEGDGAAQAGCTIKVADKAGRSRWAQLRSEPITWQGRPATLCLLRDITTLHLTEE